MSTRNFAGNRYFDDYAYIYQGLSEEEQEQFEKDYGYEYNYENESETDYEIEFDNAKHEIKRALIKFNITLFNIEVRSGYYDGLELIVTSDISGLNVDDITNTKYLKENYDNDDMRYYFGHLADYKSRIIPKIKAEIKRMDKKVLPYIAENTGFRKINCIGVFSNGEAIYEWAKC